MSVEVRLGQSPTEVSSIVSALVADRVASRLFAQDATLWGPDAEAEASIRLGWTEVWGRAAELIPAIDDLRAKLRGDGVDRVVLCGMGGSSLAPEVIASWASVPLVVLDSTHPEQVRRALEGDLSRTVVVVSSKSGSTIETRSHRAAFEAAFRSAGIDPASRVVIVTDPGSPLEESATAAGQRVFRADPNVGGRYSALTAFGLVPAGLAGADLRTLVSEAESVRELLSADDEGNPALQLAATLAAGLPRRYALAIASSPDARWGLGDWIEQLVAESTGKDGRGVLPVVLPSSAPELSGALPDSALLMTVAADADPHEPVSEAATFDSEGAGGIGVVGPLGAQLLLWEAATAVLGRLMGIDPFDQPDVESAKVAAREVLSSGATRPEALGVLEDPAGAEVLAAPEGRPAESAADLVSRLRDSVSPDGYVAIQAYLDREGAAVRPLRALRDGLAALLGVPVTLGWGPRFLHSTGQLHKGGPATGVFVQLIDDAEPDVGIPDSDSGFGTLISAQAEGDRGVLAEHGRPVLALRSADAAALADALAGAVSAENQTGASEA
ncbi:glucose-6-phosphate isomerase [Leucobacter sp. CSA1]|uniref:Glucose-6-phosphate isomerase n=1 Tax=Leucobacter chromiisoli TaxID=2796471 RepID=A0A934UUA5_9MICO|nr:glucose-6-phosphate isomerase [Leucobacter chromiisoli]MBK0417993.1 glucose-6-phosphate isomerase [Leucobacter chromiisoli]